MSHTYHCLTRFLPLKSYVKHFFFFTQRKVILYFAFLISSPFCFLSEDQSSKTPESTENRKEVDEAAGTKSSSQIPAQPPVAKSPYGKGPPFNQVCWSRANSCHYQYFD